MTDTMNRDALPSRSTESLDRLARTDGLTYERSNHQPLTPESNATPAGGLKTMSRSGSRHEHTPHIYVVYWPKQGVIKVGMSTTARWAAWRSRGVVEVATVETCCMPHAYRIEQHLLRIVAANGARAFQSVQDSRPALGAGGVGFSECYRLAASPLAGEQPESPYDYERAYGLALPPRLKSELDRLDAAWHEVSSWGVR